MPRGKKTAATKRKRTTKTAAKPATLPTCEVRGCELPALETHEGPRGPVYLCGRCGALARKSLRDEEARVDMLDVAAAPMQKASARQALRRHERVHAALR